MMLLGDYLLVNFLMLYLMWVSGYFDSSVYSVKLQIVCNICG